MVFNKPETVDEFLDIVDQVVFEIDDIMMCAEDEDGEDYRLSGMMHIYEVLATEVKVLHEDVTRGRHNFADGADLTFMPLAEKARSFIPFIDLLDILNRAHKAGFRN